MSVPAGLTKLGRYKDLALIGQGGMGAVYRAYDPSLDRNVALKVISGLSSGASNSGSDGNELLRFEREARAIARLSHPHIVQVFDFGRDEAGTPYFVMELVRGQSLDGLIRERKRLPVTDVIRLLQQAALGLAAAHAAGIVHRDIKPHNMLVDTEGCLKLVDFGIARMSGGVADGLTGTNETLGTLAYMAPEILSGQSADARADIYSLALVGFHMLTGRSPFQADSPAAVAMKQVSEPLPDLRTILTDCPAALQALLEKMAAKDRSLRIQTCEEVARLLAGIDTKGAGVALQEKRQPRTTSSRTIVLAGIGTGLCATVGLAMLLSATGVRRTKHPPHPEPTGPAATTLPEPPRPVVPTPSATPKRAAPSGPVRVAAMRFKNLSGLKQLDMLVEGLSEQVTTELVTLSGKTPRHIQLLERNQFDEQNLPELSRSTAGYTDKATVAQVGRILGAEILIQGAFQTIEGALRVTARFSATETGEILDTVSMTIADTQAKTLFALQDQLAIELRTRLARLVPRLRPEQ